jgi:hypothetical protein
MANLSKRASDVRISEVDLSSSLTGVSGCTAAIVVVGSQGDDTPRFFSSADNFRFHYGDPKASVSFDHYCALDFLLEGNSLWAVRAPGTGHKRSGASVKIDGSGATVIQGISSGVAVPTSPDFGVNVSGGETAVYQITSNRGPGSYGNNLAVRIISDNIAAPSNTAAGSSTTGGSLSPATYTYQIASIAKDGTETVASATFTVVIGSVTTTNSVNLSWNKVENAIGYRIYGRVSGSLGLIAQVGGSAVSYIDTGSIVPDAGAQPILVAGTNTPSPVFKLQVFDLTFSSVTPVETFTCSVTEQVDETGSQMEITQRVNPYSKYIRVESNVTSLLTTPVLSTTATYVALAGGTSGAAPTSADVNAAWDKFSNRELYAIDVLINAGRTVASVQQHMTTLAENRSDCIAYLDAPSSNQTAQSVVDFKNLTLNVNSSYAALIAQDVRETDPINGKLLYVPPSGVIAGLLARTFRAFQPWFSTAGLNRGQILGNVVDVRNTYTDSEATLVTTSNISYIRKFVGRGIVFWEQNTLYSANSALQFINIRVLCNIIKRSCYNYLIYQLQEPNDDILRKQVQFALEEYLTSVQAGRGISSYRVVIDDTNNTAALVNSGILAVSIVITPILAVREVQLTLFISKQGLTVDEQTIASA